MRRSAEAPAVRGVVQGAEDSLPSLGLVAANKSAREAIRVRESFMAHFSAEGAVSREGKPLQGRDQTQEEELIL